MLTAHPNSFAQKRDLHVGGRGAGNSNSMTALSFPVLDEPTLLAKTAKNVLREVDGYVRENPWPTIAVLTTLGLLAGFALARRG